MKKEAIIYIILGILILLTLLSFAYLLSLQEPLLGPTITAFIPPLPQNCSDQNEITLLWDYIFYNKPSSDGITVLTSSSSCVYAAYNITQNSRMQRAFLQEQITLGYPSNRGRTLTVTNIVNADDFINDVVELEDTQTSESFQATITAEGIGTLSIDNMFYNLLYFDDPNTPNDEYIEFFDEDDTGNFYILYGSNTTVNNQSTYLLWAIHGNATQGYLLNLGNSHIDNILTVINYLYDNNVINYLTTRNTTTLSAEDANLNFTFIFNITTPQTSEWQTLQAAQHTTYLFNDTTASSSETNSLTGVVNVNYSIEYFTFTKTQIPIIPTCTSIWTAINSSCRQDDTLITWYNDTNQCTTSNPQQPANQTINCDFNRNGIIGNNSNIQEENLDVQIYIDSNLVNVTLNYTGEKTIELRENNTVRVEFNYNFNNGPLNLKNIVIKKQSSSSNFGYLIIEGISVRKAITLDRINSSSSQVCIRNSAITDIGTISSRCTSSSETLLSCPGNATQFTCSISGNTFIVAGLTNSGVREINVQTSPSTSTTQQQTTCTPSWNCVQWSACANNQQTRICTDVNNCNSTTGRPPETQACSSTPACAPNWQCTGDAGGWRPEKCPKNGEQTQVCTDLNNCGTNTGKPSEERTCEYESDTPWIIVIITLIIFIVVIASIIIYVIIKKQPRKQDTLPKTQYSYIQQNSMQGQRPYY